MKNYKKLLYLAILIMAFTAVSAFAVDDTVVEDSAEDGRTGDCGEDSYVYWEIVPNDDGTEESPKYSMNIYGTGDTFSNLKSDGTNVAYGTYQETKWEAYRENITRVYVGDNITTLGNYAFVKNTAIHTIELGANVTVLNMGAFEGCSSLKTIYRKGNTPVEGTFDLTGIQSFGAYLFDGCKYVNNIILPSEGSYSLGTEFLKGNTALKTLYIPAACTKISKIAFRNCTALGTVYFEGDTELFEGDVTKGNEGTFYGYPFHNCGVVSGSVRSFSISARGNSPAYEYAIKNANHSITTNKTTTDSETGETTTTTVTSYYTISYIEPLLIPVYDGDEKLVDMEIVEGFAIDHEYVYEKATYIFFEDETYTELRGDRSIAEGDIIYAKKLFDFLGYMVRIADYQGLRAMYDYDTSALATLEGYSVVEVGVLGSKLYGIDPVLDLDFAHANKTVIYSGNTLVGKLVSYPKNGIATFANVAVGYENEDGTLSGTRVSGRIMNRAFVTLQNDATGETRTYYSVQGTKDLTSACEATKAAGAGILDDDAMSFIQTIIDLGADPDYIYTKEEAMAHLNAIYNDNAHILSGQHIGFAKDIVRRELNDLYNNSGELPAVLSYDVSVAYRNAGYTEEAIAFIVDDFTEYAKQGGLISMCAHMTNPDPEADDPTLANGIYRGTLDTIEKWDQLFEEGTVINTNFMTELEAIGDFLQLLEDRGVTVFWRPYHETNGAWFWFCGASIPKKPVSIGSIHLYDKDVSQEYFKNLWKLTYDYLVGERGLDNLIWVYSPNIAKDGSTSSVYDVMKYYPGDDYVDVMGIDWYTGRDINAGATPELLDSAYETTWARLAGTYTGTDYDTVTKKMPVVYGEFGPGGDLRNADPALSYNGETALKLVEMVAESGRNMGWIVFWSGWTNNWLSLDLMDKADVFMQSEMVLDLGESRTILLDRHYGQ